MTPTPYRVLSLIPPMTQLNTPYPSTAYLTGFLRSRGLAASQEDLALGLVLRLFTPAGLDELRTAAQALPERQRPPQVHHFLVAFDAYRTTVARVIAFLQGRDPTLAHRINTRGFLPEGARFQALDSYPAEEGEDPLAWAFGALGLQDRARHLATLYLNDLADVVREAVDPRFEFVRYAEKLATAQPHFDPLAEALAAPPHLLDRTLATLTAEALERHRPQLLLLSVPFPGAVYGALRIAQAAKALQPDLPIVFISATADVPRAVEAVKHGAVDFVVKPFDYKKVVDLVRNCLRRSADAAERRRRGGFAAGGVVVELEVGIGSVGQRHLGGIGLHARRQRRGLWASDFLLSRDGSIDGDKTR